MNFATANKAEKETSIKQELLGFLEELQQGKIYAIEYGDPKKPNGPMSGIRIKYIMTAGGEQFRLCQLSRGMEGGGIYHPDAESTLKQALVLHEHYTRPIKNPVMRKLLDSRPMPESSWFTISWHTHSNEFKMTSLANEYLFQKIGRLTGAQHKELFAHLAPFMTSDNGFFPFNQSHTSLDQEQ